MERENLIIFDWDDTLFPTTALHALSSHNEFVHDESILSQRLTLEKCMCDVLEEALKHAPTSTYIITNSADGWVSASTARFCPAAAPLLDRVHVISAREYFAEWHPDGQCLDVANAGGSGCCSRWKEFTFTSLAQDADHGLNAHGVPLNIVSLGDAPTDRSATLALRPYLPPGSLVKTVQLLPTPEMGRFLNQLQLLRGALAKVVQHHRSASLNISPKTNLGQEANHSNHTTCSSQANREARGCWRRSRGLQWGPAAGRSSAT